MKDPNYISDAQVNNLSERLSQLGVPITGKINSQVGYIGKRMCCDACVYGTGEHVDGCTSIKYTMQESARGLARSLREDWAEIDRLYRQSPIGRSNDAFRDNWDTVFAPELLKNEAGDVVGMQFTETMTKDEARKRYPGIKLTDGEGFIVGVEPGGLGKP